MTTQASVPSPVTPFELHLHFEGAFIFSVKTEGNSSDPGAKITGVDIYAPVCGHTNSATINSGSTYMLESYWHCIDPVFAEGYAPSPITLGALKTNIAANTPMVPGNRPIKGGWDIAFTLPVPPEDWACDEFVANAPASFTGQDLGLIPASVALDQVLIYKNVTGANFHGACFPADFAPVNGVASLYLNSEVPYIPTLQHERRATDAIAQLVGLDWVLQTPLGAASASTGRFQPRTKTGYCMMGAVSAP
ncbi:hypothetical protein [Silvibacterium dinghuense]|uniref:Uncharacterized protein n=1 Tax=Silvibacterium dinghuense TaxID=1560006 RepID=A0A4Q1S930_9BACT|nr:hypothetical protein [Silvibacterium dinghuense]RXS93399.1 hypothetical protein ESZ00_18805 [Silvibacterium dinghuense]GGH05488.1 hypothetical protein GCM10011586_22060 [Silvibacterium dinghuense]